MIAGRGVEARSGAGGIGRRRFLGRTGKPCAALTYVPADEVADHLGAVALADERAEGSPQLSIDPDGAVPGVGVFHKADGIRCIYNGGGRGLAVYIHTRYLRVYPRQEQAPWQIGLCATNAGGLFSMQKIIPGDSMSRAMPGHMNCRHRHYGLSCAIYERLLRESGQRCGICSCEARVNTAGKLFIDHDRTRGLWAVRGLLCHRCNSLIGDRPGWGAAFPDGYRSYLDKPWYVRRAAELGVPLDTLAEPDRSARVRDVHGRLWGHTWLGWSCGDGRARGRAWDWLADRFGPIGLTVLRPHGVATPRRPPSLS